MDPMTGVLTRRPWEDTQSQKKYHVRMEAEAGVMCLDLGMTRAVSNHQNLGEKA